MELLKELCAISGTSGDEGAISRFIIEFVKKERYNWAVVPEMWYGTGFKDNVVLIFGTPRLALFAHLDTVGFTARYDNFVIPIGGIDASNGDVLEYENARGKKETARLIIDEAESIMYMDSDIPIEPGTCLTYKPNFKLEEEWIISPYLDNRLSVWALLHLAPKLDNVALVFSTYEEHGGGAAGHLARLLYEKYGMQKAIITDVTWASQGVFPGKGPAISLRDSRIPRRSYVNELRKIAMESQIPHQLEVEASGGSDGKELQNLPYPIDWCFVGPPSFQMHSAKEKVSRLDVEHYLNLLQTLVEKL